MIGKDTFACNTCTWRLVRLCYGRAPWFRLVREPVVLGMRVMAWWHDIERGRGRRGHPDCDGCVRYMKDRLKRESSAFRWLNSRINPLFNRIRDSIVTKEEVEDARRFARETSECNDGFGTEAGQQP